MALTIEDRLTLHEMMGRYAHAVDVGCTEEEFLAFFTDDAVLVSPFTGRHEGVAGVKAFRANLVPRWGRLQVRHVITNVFIDEGPGSDRARVKAYLTYFKTQQELPAGVDPKTEFVFTGSYDCVVRKVDGKWKMERRIVRADPLERPL